MIRISELKTDYKTNQQGLMKAAAKSLGILPENIHHMTIVRKSIDARKRTGTARSDEEKGKIYAVYTVDVSVDNEQKLLNKLSDTKAGQQKARASRHRAARSKTSAHISPVQPEKYHFPLPGNEDLKYPPVIAGTGPAGLFAGLMLARSGYRPILFERGLDVHARRKKVEHFWETGQLDTNCNVQFGEGGAGTFSDGKLNTLVKDKSGRNRKVLEIFHEAGASEEILYLNKPHIGTDVLMGVVENIRNEIIRLGGQVYFNCEITDIRIENDTITAVKVNHNKLMETNILILAIGHSARNTFEMLLKRRLTMSAKAFAVGVRIEHPQVMVDRIQYGRDRDEFLPAADYKLTHTCANGRGVYTFCMCPGGYVVNASSEEGATAVNGMSYSGRDSANANSAVIVTVTPEDFGSSGDPLCGMHFQRKLERACFMEAYRCGGKYRVPIQRFEDFCRNEQTQTYGHITPVHKGGCVPANLRRCLPEFICESLEEGIHAFGRKMSGFDDGDALLSGVESRTSSPVRIERSPQLESNIRGIYPCGEGAGYAGGITSAAMDGLRVAEEIVRRFAPPKIKGV